MKKMTQKPEVVVVDKGIDRTDYIQSRKGQYRAIVKVKAGFMTVVDDLGIQANWGKQQWNKPIDVFRGFKRGALQSIQFRAEGSSAWLTVFARTGNKVKVADDELLADMNVGDINQDWSSSNLYNHRQYAVVGAKTWADKAFVKNS
jgi:putative heme degradation protein